MKILLILLATMTFTVKSWNSVEADGQWPYDFDVTYSTTSHQKGDVRQGDTATLAVKHLEGIDIERVEVYIKSNKSAGAGTFTVTADGRTVTTKSGTYKDWFGAYNNSEFQPLSLLTEPVSGVDELVVTTEGTENSLHIEKYVITWKAAEPRTVTLMHSYRLYTTLTETSGNQGVLLPALSDTANWHFLGWTKTELWESYQCPSYYPARTTFYPKEDCTLWALYVYRLESSPIYMTEVESGEYMYVNRDMEKALSGVPSGGVMNYEEVSAENENLYYDINFTAPDTAYITHALTGTPIGYDGTQLAANASPWLVYHDGEETLFYIHANNKPYVLWLDWFSGNAFLFQASPGASPMSLMAPPSAWGMPSYTCHPETQDIDSVSVQKDDLERVLMQFGPYELILQGDKKYIRLK